jgi:hypothetical protein
MSLLGTFTSYDVQTLAILVQIFPTPSDGSLSGFDALCSMSQPQPHSHVAAGEQRLWETSTKKLASQLYHSSRWVSFGG